MKTKINWDKQISDQISKVELSDNEQKLLSLIYNTLIGNYDPTKTSRYAKQLLASYHVMITTKEFTKLFGVKTCEEIEALYSPLDKHLQFSYGSISGKGRFSSFLVLSGFSFSEDYLGFYVTERFIPIMIRYIDKLVKPEYIKNLPLSEIFQHV